MPMTPVPEIDLTPVAFFPSALTTSPPCEYSSAAKCQPPWFWAL